MQDDVEEPVNEHWQEQQQLANESRQASSPHHHARTVAQAFRPIYPVAGAGTDEQQNEETGRVKKLSTTGKQNFQALDFGGQGLRALSKALFQYSFLEKLHLPHNKLEQLPVDIGQLKNLVHLDVSGNQLTEIPEEVGMLTNLQKLYLFDNHVRVLPWALGFLFNLETLGVAGNPLNEEQLTKIMHEGTKSLVEYFRENMPSKCPFEQSLASFYKNLPRNFS